MLIALFLIAHIQVISKSRSLSLQNIPSMWSLLLPSHSRSHLPPGTPVNACARVSLFLVLTLPSPTVFSQLSSHWCSQNGSLVLCSNSCRGSPCHRDPTGLQCPWGLASHFISKMPQPYYPGPIHSTEGPHHRPLLFRHADHALTLRPLLFSLPGKLLPQIHFTSYLFPFCISSSATFSVRPISTTCPCAVLLLWHHHSSFSTLHISSIHRACHHLTCDMIGLFMMINVGIPPCNRSPIKGNFCSLKYPRYLEQCLVYNRHSVNTFWISQVFSLF